jgi:hypothetical protein
VILKAILKVKKVLKSNKLFESEKKLTFASFYAFFIKVEKDRNPVPFLCLLPQKKGKKSEKKENAVLLMAWTCLWTI